MQENAIVPDLDDEINIRAILLRIWQVRRVLLFSALVPALVTFGYIVAFLPKNTYRASAYVFIGNQNYSYIETEKGNVYPNLPDVSAIAKLATSPNMLSAVTENPEVQKILGSNEFKIGSPVATVMGKDQIRLEVVDEDAEQAVLLANAWAEELSSLINSTYYGVIGDAAQLETRLQQTQTSYEKAQSSYEDALSNSVLEILDAELDQKKSSLRCVIGAQISGERLLQDLSALELKLKAVPDETQMQLDEVLALATLRQDSLFPQTCNSLKSASDYTVQIDAAYYSDYTIKQALTAILDMQGSLQTRMLRLAEERATLETEIPQIRVEYEQKSNQLGLIARERGVSKDIYDRVYSYLVSKDSGTWQGASVSAPAREASEEANLLTYGVYILLAGLLGLVLSFSIVMLLDWWNGQRENGVGAP